MLIKPRADTLTQWSAVEADLNRVRASMAGASTEDQLARTAQVLQRMAKNAQACAMLVKGDIAQAKARVRIDQAQRKTA